MMFCYTITVIKLFRWWTLSVIISHMIFPVIGPSTIKIIDQARDYSDGLHVTNDMKVNNLKIENSDRLSGSNLCRRSMMNCVTRFLRKPIETPSTKRLEDGRYIRKFPTELGWINSMEIKIREMSESFLFRLSPELRDEFNLEHAHYEEAIAIAIRSTEAHRWYDDGALANILSDMANTRIRSTASWGGFSPEINRYLLNVRLPQLCDQLGITLSKTLQVFMDGPTNPHVEMQIPILYKLFKFARQDTTLGPILDTLKPKFDRVNAKYLHATAIPVPWQLNRAEIPSRPGLRSLIKLKTTESSHPRYDLQWLNFQFLAEEDHIRYLESVGLQGPLEWSSVMLHTNTLKDRTRQSAWVDGVFYPDKFSLDAYKALEAVELSRRALVKRSTIIANHRSYLQKGIWPFVPEIRTKRRLALETLMIESFSRPNSHEALKMLQNRLWDDDTIAGVYVDHANLAHDNGFHPPPDLDWLRSLRYNEIELYREPRGPVLPDIYDPAPTERSHSQLRNFVEHYLQGRERRNTLW